MDSYYLTCRSLTYAQRVSRALTAARIRNMIVRTPQRMSAEGCGYAVRVSPSSYADSLLALDSTGLPPKKVYRMSYGGHIEEVRL